MKISIETVLHVTILDTGTLLLIYGPPGTSFGCIAFYIALNCVSIMAYIFMVCACVALYRGFKNGSPAYRELRVLLVPLFSTNELSYSEAAFWLGLLYAISGARTKRNPCVRN